MAAVDDAVLERARASRRASRASRGPAQRGRARRGAGAPHVMDHLPARPAAAGYRGDHEPAAGQRGEIGREREALQRRDALVLAAQALLDAPREARLDARACALERGIIDIAADHLAAAFQQHLGDARPHRAQSDDANASDRFHAAER